MDGVEGPLLRPGGTTSSSADSEPDSSWVRVERLHGEHHNNLFLESADDDSAGLINVLTWTEGFALLQLGVAVCSILILFYYWSCPWVLPLLVIAQLAVQFVLLCFTDFFCRLSLQFSWNCPLGRRGSCVITLCDWLLVFCFLGSWTAAMFCLAPVFEPLQRFLQKPPLESLTVAALSTQRLLGAGALHFAPGLVQLNKTSVLVASMSPAADDDAAALAFALAAVGQNQTAGGNLRDAAASFPEMMWAAEGAWTSSSSTVAAALLQDRRPRNRGGSSSELAAKQVWAVCSDGADLPCGCGGGDLAEFLSGGACMVRGDGHICGWQMPYGMAEFSDVVPLVRAGLEQLALPRARDEIFICLTDPDAAKKQAEKRAWRALLFGLPFLVASVVVTLRLVFFYLCQASERMPTLADLMLSVTGLSPAFA